MSCNITARPNAALRTAPAIAPTSPQVLRDLEHRQHRSRCQVAVYHTVLLFRLFDVVLSGTSKGGKHGVDDTCLGRNLHRSRNQRLHASRRLRAAEF